MPKVLKRMIGYAAAVAALLPSVPARSQSFSVDTTATSDGSQYDYAFTLRYDQAGAVQGLTDGIWDWTFYVDPTAPPPTAIALPSGWQYAYDSSSGEFDFYTEGADGFGNGDFGPDVVEPGQSLSGFGLTTPAAPGLSVAFATDVQYNQDATLATLPTAVQASPEPEPPLTFSIGAAVLVATSRRCLRRSRGCRPSA